MFCVGASPFDADAFSQVVERNFSQEIKGIPCFYCRGAWNEDRMFFADRTLCKMLQKSVAKKDPKEYEVWERTLMEAMG